jgi:hypothetical protein
MPILSLNQRPDLTIEKTLQILETAFGSKYKVYATKLLGADIVVKKSGWTGVAFKIVQKEGKTNIKYWAMSPSAFVRMLGLGLIPLLILYYSSWKKMQNEIKSFLEASQDFK